MYAGERLMAKMAWVGVVLVYLSMAGCGSQGGKADPKTFKMGERVQVGPLIYTVLDTEWFDSLGEGTNLRVPKHRFLAVRLSVTNSGPGTAEIPGMSLVDAHEAAFGELSDGRGCDEWLGFLRTAKSAETIHGRALFDVPAASYQLKLVNEGEPDPLKTATVDLPLDLKRTPLPGEVAR
jgi:hypothetical protein